jgi:hypothetical protein
VFLGEIGMGLEAMVFRLSALALGQGFQAAPPLKGVESDFRPYVFGAYGAVVVLLFLFSFWSSGQLQRVERKLDRLLERSRKLEETAPR